MPNNSNKVFAGKPLATGGVLTAPKGTAAPATARVALNAAFKATGYVSDAGLTKSESRDFSEIKDWAGLTIKKTQNGFAAMLKFAFLEYMNADAAKTVYGASAVTVTAATSTTGELVKVNVKGDEPPHLAWVFDMVDGPARGRIYVGDGQITEVGDTSYNTEGGAIREVTVTAYPDANGDFFVELLDDGITL